MSSQAIELWVSAGSLKAPYYRFYTDAEGSTELEALVLDSSKTYIFRRLNTARSHPFYLKVDPDSPDASGAYNLSGDGSSAVGITGNQSFTLSFSDPSEAPPSLLTYCTAHPTMQSSWSINPAPSTPSAPYLTAASDSGNSDSDALTNDNTPTFSGRFSLLKITPIAARQKPKPRKKRSSRLIPNATCARSSMT